MELGTGGAFSSLVLSKESILLWRAFCYRVRRSPICPNLVMSRLENHFEELDEALERSARELEIISTIYKQRGHAQEASDIDNTLMNLSRAQESEDY